MKKGDLVMKKLGWSYALVVGVIGMMQALAQSAPQPPAQPQPPAPQQVEVQPKVPVDSTKAQLSYEKEKNMNLQMQSQIQALQAKLRPVYDGYEADIVKYEAAVKKANGWCIDDKLQCDKIYDREQDKWFQVNVPKPAAAGPEAPK